MAVVPFPHPGSAITASSGAEPGAGPGTQTSSPSWRFDGADWAPLESANEPGPQRWRHERPPRVRDHPARGPAERRRRSRLAGGPRSPPMGGARHRADRPLHGAARRLHRERGHSRHPDQSVGQRRRHPVRHRRLRARLCGDPHHRRASGRHLRPQAAAHGRHGWLRAGIGALRAGPERSDARPLPRAPGRDGGADVPPGAQHRAGHLPPARAGASLRSPGRGDRDRHHCRPAGRRPHHPERPHRRVVALDLPGQPADRNRGAGGGRPGRHRVAAASTPPGSTSPALGSPPRGWCSWSTRWWRGRWRAGRSGRSSAWPSAPSSSSSSSSTSDPFPPPPSRWSSCRSSGSAPSASAC